MHLGVLQFDAVDGAGVQVAHQTEILRLLGAGGTDEQVADGVAVGVGQRAFEAPLLTDADGHPQQALIVLAGVQADVGSQTEVLARVGFAVLIDIVGQLRQLPGGGDDIGIVCCAVAVGEIFAAVISCGAVETLHFRVGPCADACQSQQRGQNCYFLHEFLSF